jgi:DNA-binding transcriptional ArsR family regulator
MHSSESAQLVTWLKAAGESSRLRLLFLCSKRELSVSDLARALNQSEPRVSRHLRILCEAGLLERLRQGQWVHYRLANAPAAASFTQGLLAQLDRTDPQLSRDFDRIQDRPAALSEFVTSSESRLGRALKGFVETNTSATKVASALVVGVEHLELLESAASLAGGCTAIAHSARAAQSARAFAVRRGFNCRVLLGASPQGLSERDISRLGRTFDVVILDHLAVPNTRIAELLAQGRRALARAGRIWLFERYESLEGSREKVIEHPLARLRRLLGSSGLSCERLSPIESDGEHVLAAVAAPISNVDESTLRRA